MDDYYRRIARDADAWARGLTMMNGGENLLSIAATFENDARSAAPEDQVALTDLAAALRRHVQAVRDFHQERLTKARQ
jgi:hypothetical protein